jgi:hypothetical protein
MPSNGPSDNPGTIQSVVTADSVRIEGLDVATAAHLVACLR